MESCIHAQQGTVVSNKIHEFLMVRVSMKYDKWKGTITSGSKMWDVK